MKFKGNYYSIGYNFTWRRRVQYLLVALAGLLEDVVCLLTLGVVIFNSRMLLAFNERLEEWSDDE